MQEVSVGLTIAILHYTFQAITPVVLQYPVNGKHPGAILVKKRNVLIDRMPGPESKIIRYLRLGPVRTFNYFAFSTCSSSAFLNCS